MSEPRITFTIPTPSEPVKTPRRANKALWLIGIGLLANAAVLLTRGQAPDIVLDRSALAQATPAGNGNQLLGARGIYMMPAQLSPQTFGLYLLDVDSGNIVVYKALPDSPNGSRFSLMAARSYKYDRFLEDLNNVGLTPRDVQNQVEARRMRQELQVKEGQPTVDQNPKPDENAPDKPVETPK
jgi:hypothetical protein